MRKVIVMGILLILVIPASGVAADDATYSVTSYGMFASNDAFMYEVVDNPAGMQPPDQALSDEHGVIPYWVDMVDADLVMNTGNEIYVAVLDTGLVPDYGWLFGHANIRTDLGMGFSHELTWDSMANDFAWGPLDDTRGIYTNTHGSGHGTHVTSTIVGYNWFDAFTIRGVAPEVHIIPILCLDTWFLECPDPDYTNEEWGVECHDGYVVFNGGTWEMVAAGIDYAADLKAMLQAPLIISMSLGGPEPDPIIGAAIDNAIDEGCIVVASAGNDGYDGMGWPGAYDEVISTGAAGWTEKYIAGSGMYWWLGNDVPEKLNTMDYWGNEWQLYLESFSSRPSKDRGQKARDLDLTDPGALIVGPYKVDTWWNEAAGQWWWYPSWNYYYLWGTSMAAPHVSGIAALVLESYPDVDQGTMHKILTGAASGCPMPDANGVVIEPYGGWHNVDYDWWGGEYGAGFLTADMAMKKAKIYAK